MTRTSLWDRIVFGSLSGLFGAILGAVAAVMAAYGLNAGSVAWSIIGFSAVYFFAVGAVRGPDAGFLVGEALSALGAVGAAEVGAVPNEPGNADRPAAWSSVWLLGMWLLVVLVLAWQARA